MNFVVRTLGYVIYCTARSIYIFIALILFVLRIIFLIFNLADDLDVQKYAPTWHCIVGRNFGSYVTHETKHFIYFYLGQVAVLLFKSG